MLLLILVKRGIAPIKSKISKSISLRLRLLNTISGASIVRNNKAVFASIKNTRVVDNSDSLTKGTLNCKR